MAPSNIPGGTQEAEPPPGPRPSAPHRRLGVPARLRAGAGDKWVTSFQGLLQRKHCGILATNVFFNFSRETSTEVCEPQDHGDTARPWGGRLGPEAEMEWPARVPSRDGQGRLPGLGARPTPDTGLFGQASRAPGRGPARLFPNVPSRSNHKGHLPTQRRTGAMRSVPEASRTPTPSPISVMPGPRALRAHGSCVGSLRRA